MANIDRIEFYWKPERQTLDISIPLSVGEAAIAEMRKAMKLEISAGAAWGIAHIYAVIFDDESEAPYVVGADPMDFPQDTGTGLNFNFVPDRTLRYARASVWVPDMPQEEVLRIARSPELRSKYLVFQSIPAVSRVSTNIIQGCKLPDAVGGVR